MKERIPRNENLCYKNIILACKENTLLCSHDATCVRIKCLKEQTMMVHMSNKTLQCLNTVFEVLLKQVPGDYTCNNHCIYCLLAGHTVRYTRRTIKKSCFID